MFFDYFAKSWISNFLIFDYFAKEKFVVLPTFVCMPAALLAFTLLSVVAQRVPNAPRDAFATRSSWDKLSALQNLDFQIFRNFEINKNNRNL